MITILCLIAFTTISITIGGVYCLGREIIADYKPQQNLVLHGQQTN